MFFFIWYLEKIEEAACGHIAQLERYLQNSEME